MIEREEFIGKQAKIVYHNTVCEGRIVNETKKTIWIENDEGIKKFIKAGATIIIAGTAIQGKDIIKRPEERIKLKNHGKNCM